MGILPTIEVPATDGVIDAIAEDHESKALALRGPDAGHPGNVEALKIEIARVKALGAPRAQDSIHRYVRTEQRQVSWRNAPRNLARNKGRRTMGRAGGR